ADLALELARPGVVRRSLVDGNSFALEVFELRDFRRSFPDQKLKVGVEIALGEQHALGALPGHGRRRREKVVGSRLQRRHEAGELRGIDHDLALEPLGDLVGKIDVEALITSGKIWKGMRCERAIDRRAQRRWFLSIDGRGEKHCGTGGRKHISNHGATLKPGPASILWTIATGSNRTRRMRRQRAETRSQYRYRRRGIGCPAARVRYRFVPTTFSAKIAIPEKPEPWANCSMRPRRACTRSRQRRSPMPATLIGRASTAWSNSICNVAYRG